MHLDAPVIIDAPVRVYAPVEQDAPVRLTNLCGQRTRLILSALRVPPSGHLVDGVPLDRSLPRGLPRGLSRGLPRCLPRCLPGGLLSGLRGGLPRGLRKGLSSAPRLTSIQRYTVNQVTGGVGRLVELTR